MDRSTVCQRPGSPQILVAGFEFTAIHVGSGLYRFRPYISCALLEENVCARIAEGIPCPGSTLHQADRHRKIPITITGFVPEDSVYKCRPPKYTPSLRNLPTTFSPIGKCCYIGHPDHILSEGDCYTKMEHHLPIPNQNLQAAGSKRPLGPNADPEAKGPKYRY
jgi:hypothetical protein